MIITFTLTTNNRSLGKFEFHPLSGLGAVRVKHPDQVTKGIKDAWLNQSEGTEQDETMKMSRSCVLEEWPSRSWLFISFTRGSNG
jgi:hypothetical protein